MGKKYKPRRHIDRHIEPVSTTADEKRRRFVSNLKYLVFLILWSIFLAAVYIACISYEISAILYIYTILGFALAAAFFIVNGGIKRRDPRDIKCPEGMGCDEFAVKKAAMLKRISAAKYLMASFIPFWFIMLIDYLIIYYREAAK